MNENAGQSNAEARNNRGVSVVDQILSIDAELAATEHPVRRRVLILKMLFMVGLVFGAWRDFLDSHVLDTVGWLAGASLTGATVLWDIVKVRRKRARLQNALDLLLSECPRPPRLWGTN
jgi:hypothetical protein